MRYWYTVDSLFGRIVRVSAELSGAIRNFCFVFILGLIFQPKLPIKIGIFSISEELISSVSIPVLIFIFLDVLHPLVYLVGLHLVQLFHWKRYKRYDGAEGQPYDESKDWTELIIEPNPLQLTFVTGIPTILLISKIIVVIWIVVAFAIHLKIG